MEAKIRPATTIHLKFRRTFSNQGEFEHLALQLSISRKGVVARARNIRLLRLVERSIPRLVA